jgi:alpha-tubulin suppressor-like RCC1 family protein
MRLRLVLALVIATLAGCLPSFDFTEDAGSSAGEAGTDAGADVSTQSDATTDAPSGPDATAEAGGDGGALSFPVVNTLGGGFGHTCVLRDGGTIDCWGDDSDYQLGRGPASYDGTESNPAPVFGLYDAGVTANALELHVGGYYSCVLLADANDDAGATPYCWGDNDDGELGANGGSAWAPVPVISAVTMEPLTGVVRLDTGVWAACALGNDGTWYCWGNNGPAPLVAGSVSPVLYTATPIPKLAGATRVAVGSGHTCSIDAQGVVSCFGDNDHRQAGQATSTAECTFDDSDAGTPCIADPAPVSGVSSAKQLALGIMSSCVLVDDGGVLCWGSDATGELGTWDGGGGGAMCPAPGAPTPDAEAPCTEIPRAIPLPLPAVQITGAEDPDGVGASYCALLTDGRVFCWGSNDDGQLAIGNADQGIHQVPGPALNAQGTSLTGVVELASGSQHKCALLGDGGVLCWGTADGDGALGSDAAVEYYALPVQW